MKDARKRDEDKVTRTWRNFRVTGVGASQRNLSCVTVRKTDREQVVVVSSCTASIFAAAHFTVKQASRHSHLSFSTDVPRFANYCGICVWAWSLWIYLYDYDTTIARCEWCLSFFLSASIRLLCCTGSVWMSLVAFICSPAIVDWDLQWKPFEL